MPMAAQQRGLCNKTYYSQRTIHLVMPDIDMGITLQGLPSPTSLHVATALLQALHLGSESHDFGIQALEVSITHHVKLVLPETRGKKEVG